MADGMITVVIAALTLVLELVRRERGTMSGFRRQLRADLDLLKDLPADSPARDTMLASVEWRIQARYGSDPIPRDPWDFGLGGVFLLGGGLWLWRLLANEGRWWQITIAIVIAILGFTGVMNGIKPTGKPRSTKGS